MAPADRFPALHASVLGRIHIANTFGTAIHFQRSSGSRYYSLDRPASHAPGSADWHPRRAELRRRWIYRPAVKVHQALSGDLAVRP